MASGPSTIRTRTALAIAAWSAVILVANAAYLIETRRTELRTEIEERATLFARVATTPICAGYETYYASGFYKFKELMQMHLRLEPDVEKILIVNTEGQILVDSSELGDQKGPREGTAPVRSIDGAERLGAVKRDKLARLPDKDSGGHSGEGLEIIAPYNEDWGRHRLSVSYRVSYKSLRSSVERVVYAVTGRTLLAILASVLVAVVLASRIHRTSTS